MQEDASPLNGGFGGKRMSHVPSFVVPTTEGTEIVPILPILWKHRPERGLNRR
jgi:hypothetical protein